MSSKKRKLRVILYDPSGHGGICHYTHQLAESLTQAGTDVTVATTDNYELQELTRNFKTDVLYKQSRLKTILIALIFGVRRLNSAAKSPVRRSESLTRSLHRPFLLNILKLCRLNLLLFRAVLYFLRRRPHVIHVQWLVDRDEEYKFLKVLKLLGFKIVYTAHDLLPHDSDTPKDVTAYRKIYEQADRVIVHAESSRTEMVQVFNVDPEKVCVIPHGSNDFFYEDRGISKQEARRELGLPEEKRVVLFFGLIKRYKGLEYLIESFDEVKQSVPNVMLLIVGKIYDGDAEVHKHYSALIAKLSGREDVMCTNRYIPFDKVGRYFAAADVVVLPYTKTSQSGVLLSAYAAGRPVVVTDTGGLSEVVKDGQSGFIVPPRNAKALANAIVNTVRSADRMEQMGNCAKYLAESTYSWKIAASKTIDLYRSLACTR